VVAAQRAQQMARKIPTNQTQIDTSIHQQDEIASFSQGIFEKFRPRVYINEHSTINANLSTGPQDTSASSDARSKTD